MWGFTEIIGAQVFYDGAFHTETVYIAIDRFVSQQEFVAESQTAIVEMLDGHGRYFVPGLTDCSVQAQTNFDHADTQTVYQALRALAKDGTTQLLAVAAASLTTLAEVFRRGGVNNGALLAGIHLRCPDDLCSDPREKLASRFGIASATIKMISTINDSKREALPVSSIALLQNRGDGLLQWQPDTMAPYVAEGAAMALDTASNHLSPEMIRHAFKRAPGHVLLTTGGPISAARNSRVPTTLLDGLKTVVAAGVPLEAALYAASEYPATLLGIEQKAGLIKPGRRANGLLLDQDLNLEQVFLNGYPLLA